MAKTEKELMELKKKVEELTKELEELSEDELQQVTGGYHTTVASADKVFGHFIPGIAQA